MFSPVSKDGSEELVLSHYGDDDTTRDVTDFTTRITFEHKIASLEQAHKLEKSKLSCEAATAKAEAGDCIHLHEHT